jgi:hypothetical protein
MAESELCSLDGGVDGKATASNFVDGPIVDRCTAMLPGEVTLNAVILNQDACWFDKP